MEVNYRIMKVYFVKGHTFLDIRFSFYVVDDDHPTDTGASVALYNSIVQHLKGKYSSDIYIEDFNCVGNCDLISKMRERNYDDIH